MADSRPPGWPFEGVNEDGSIEGAVPPPIFEPPTTPAPPLAPPAQPGPPAAPPGPPPAAPPGPPPAPSAYPPPAPSAYPPPAPGPPAGYPPQPAAYPPSPGQPPAGYMSPPAGYVPPPPPKKSRSVLKVLGIIGLVVLLGIGGCTAWFVSTVKAPVDESNRFLALIDQGDYAGAVAASDSACNGGMQANELSDIFQGADIDYNLNNSSITNSSAVVGGSFSGPGLPWTNVQVGLQKRDGEWGVCSLNLSE